MQRHLRIEVVDIEIDRQHVMLTLSVTPPETKRTIVASFHIAQFAPYTMANGMQNIDDFVGLKGYVNTDANFNPIKLDIEFPVTLEGQCKVVA